jgi:hypothetical protein
MPWYSSWPRTVAPAMRSFIRLRQRRNVLFPHPDGPMNAVISRARIVRLIFSMAGTEA